MKTSLLIIIILMSVSCSDRNSCIGSEIKPGMTRPDVCEILLANGYKDVSREKEILTDSFDGVSWEKIGLDSGIIIKWENDVIDKVWIEHGVGQPKSLRVTEDVKCIDVIGCTKIK